MTKRYSNLLCLLLQQEASLGSSGGMGKGDHKQNTPGGTAGEPPQKGQPQGSPQAEPGQTPAGRP